VEEDDNEDGEVESVVEVVEVEDLLLVEEDDDEYGEALNVVTARSWGDSLRTSQTTVLPKMEGSKNMWQ
jgi:hypothetical protein